MMILCLPLGGHAEQNRLPDHPLMQALAAGDQERFYAEELAERQDAGMPPFGRLAALIVSGRDLQ